MGATAASGTVGERARTRMRALEPAEVAWIVLLPCAALVLLAIVLLGPPLGRAFFEPTSDRFWPEALVVPEPVEHARYVLSLLGPPLVVAAIVAAQRRQLRMGARVARVAIAAAQLCTVGVVALAVIAQHDVLFRSYIPPNVPDQLFTVATLVASAGFAVALGALARRPGVLARVGRLTRETSLRRAVCAAIAVVLVAIWLMPAFNVEHSAGQTEGTNLIPWDMSETYAVLNGRTPLVDFHSQYAQLIPYLAAGPMRIVGASLGTWSAVMVGLSGLALLAVYGVFRRVAHGPLLGLAVFVPFLAGGAFLINGRLSSLEVISLWPLRYGGPYLLAWLTARHLDRVAPRRRWLLLAVGGVVALNNAEFGIAALGGTLAALLYADPPRSARAAWALARDAAGGLLAAVALVAVLCLIQGGALPRFGLLFEFAHIFGVGGWILEPLVTVGFYLAVYVTYAAAVVTAAVRAARGDEGRVLTGMLAWTGIFGFGSASYYVGRSDVLDLVALFSAWCFALMLLTIVVVERLARTGRRPTLVDLTVLLGCGVAVCAVFQMPRPWAEVARVQRHGEPVYRAATALAFVKATARPGERVAIFSPLGHRIAYDAGVVNVLPYASAESMPTMDQFEEALSAMRRASVTRAYVNPSVTYPALLDALSAAGFAPAARRDRYVMLAKQSR